MPLISFTDDRIVKRLRVVMAGIILFSMFNTLACQPAKFWSNPETAIRADGLGIHNTVNHTFEFFLSHGWQPYVASALVYLALVFVVVSILPRKAALIACLSFIFGHYYVGSNWLAVGWHLGFNGVAIYGLAVSAAIAWTVSPIPAKPGDQIIRRLRWVMYAVMLIDPLVTLIGEPGSYWAHPETVHEGNSFWRWSMMHGWWVYILMDQAYCLGALWLASTLPRFFAVMTIFAFMFGHFIGAINWFFYDWRLGMECPVIYGIALSSIIVLVSYRRNRTSNSGIELSPEPPTAARVFCC
jgi:hypothetical protein